MWLMRDRRLSQSYYLVFGLLLLGLAALGASLEIAPTPALFSYALLALAHPWIAQVLQGSVLVIAGLLDHRQLVRALGERPAEPACGPSRPPARPSPPRRPRRRRSARRRAGSSR